MSLKLVHGKKKREPFILSISSGKGGVGKTLSVVNIALSAAVSGKKVLILDGDLGMSNVDVVLGLHGRYNLKDVFDGYKSLDEIMLTGPCGIKIIPSGSGISSLSNLTDFQKQILVDQFEKIQDDLDLIIIDTGAGVGPNVTHFNSFSEFRFLITTPEPHSITDAYATIKVLSQKGLKKNIHLIVNMVRSEREGQEVSQRLIQTCKDFLDLNINFIGSVPFDKEVSRYVLSTDAGSKNNIKTLSGQAWSRISRAIMTNFADHPISHRSSPWIKLVMGEPS